MNDSLAILAPLLFMALPAAVATPLLKPRGAQLRRYHVPLGLLILQLAMVPVSWLLIWAAPGEPAFSGAGTCPDIDPGSARGTVLVVLFFASCVVGGLAVAAAYAADRPRLTKAAWFALVALAAPFGIVVAAVYTALCTLN